MRDPYDVLGVARNANAAEIKSAYRKRAKKLHPDANKHDPKAATRFAELNAAHEIVGDADKRKAFDRGEIRAEDASLPLCEIELELKCGRPEHLFELALAVHELLPVTLGGLTKAERGYALLAGSDTWQVG